MRTLYRGLNRIASTGPRAGATGPGWSLGVTALVVFVAVLSARLPGHAQEMNMQTDPIPQLRRVGDVSQLYVDGNPFLLLGGELGNSTASDLTMLDEAMRKCRQMNLNTIMLPVYWDRIEPEEGTFDFTLVQGAIDLAREHELRLVYLWFGTWKNSMSCYAPSWVKRDTARFKRAQQSSGEQLEIISPSCDEAAGADARAFAQLMQWTRAYDAGHHTVIMVQVENEIGMIPEPRDHSQDSQRAYRDVVPEPIMSMVVDGKLGPEAAELWIQEGRKRNGSWRDTFGGGPEGEEFFSAWQFATYVEKVASAGKASYPLPMFTNAALIRPGYRPDQRPSGAPLPHLLEVWRAGAPSLDMICPDIYFPNFMEWCQRYTRNGNPLFIPEMSPSLRASGNVVYAIAKHNAIGTGPFAIENVSDEKAHLIRSCYGTLSGMADLILQAQQDGTLIGLSPQVTFDWETDNNPQRGELGGVVFEADFDRQKGGEEIDITTLPTHGPGRWEAPPDVPRGAVMILQLAPEEFAIVGMGVKVTFAPADGQGHVGIDRVQEGRYENGNWVGGRWLNGDETHQGRHVHLYYGNWTVQRVTLYRY
ncbi:MAG: DUF5597 domain-containing protein [Phycisphaeraceae bacterium]